MEPVKLAKALRSLADPIDPCEYEGWAKILKPLLPPEPLSKEFLDGVFEGVDSLGQTIVLDHLLRLGRIEVADRAVPLAELGRAAGVLLAEALIIAGDARGYDILERLYIYSTEHPEDKSKSSGPSGIFDVLVERGDSDRRALTLRRRLVAWDKKRSGS